MVKSPKHITRSILDHIHMKDGYLEDHIIEVSVLKKYFSDHDAVRCTIYKIVDFTVL